MESEIRRHVRVEPGGVITIQSDELPDGAEADVIVRVRRPVQRGRYTALIGSAPCAYASPEEATAFLRRERDAWRD